MNLLIFKQEGMKDVESVKITGDRFRKTAIITLKDGNIMKFETSEKIILKDKEGNYVAEINKGDFSFINIKMVSVTIYSKDDRTEMSIFSS
ncbi:hypothetical protein KAS79_02435 [Candidatus Parcubacteria bacterium]|nr:hypothetical protein [Candidatus Parcubacteria bacterium]